ncbi:Acyl-coenzyme A oxidase (Acyl-CoA oxidase) [Halocaridina rubra]|uniref:Acyl-coenzyme A oxidase (Acyl-CoA oxidase) n=1 Tax=Halocaridina rubra TaxID=373956 RepID=A0AAN8WQP6_HALRR
MGSHLAILRKQAVSIVDAFDMHDFVIDSTLGSWDGNVYERMYEKALTSPLNQKDVPDAYYKYLRPLMKANL